MSTGVALCPPSTNEDELGQLRHAFDRSFAQPAIQPAQTMVRLISIEVAERPFAIEANQIAGLAKVKRIVPLPSRIPEFHGIAGIRGGVVPVFNLAALLEIESRGNPQWLALAKSETAMALAFETLTGQVEVGASDIYPEEVEGRTAFVRMLVRIGAQVRPLLDIFRIAQEIHRKAGLSDSAGSKS